MSTIPAEVPASSSHGKENGVHAPIPAGQPDNQSLFQLFRRSWSKDLLSGFLVFLIALPLCLGISKASGYPAMAGIFTAIVGGFIAPIISNSELTIKGPAAGLIVIAIECVKAFGYTEGNEVANFNAYKLALGIGVAAAVLQILFGLFRSGILGEFFPSAAVHGMLAAIGIIIGAKQIHFALGVSPPASMGPLELIQEIPFSFYHMNPEIAFIGIVSLVILFGLNFVKNKYVKRIPAPMLVLLFAIPMGYFFDLGEEHTYTLFGGDFQLGPNFLVNVPQNMLEAVTFPDFSGVFSWIGLKFVISFALVGTLESLLSAKAIDLIDPMARKTNHNRDILAVGVGNFIASFIGGLPMISEIVRSRANIDNGAKSRFANMFHGMFLLGFVALFPALVNKIPVAALAAMLVFTGYRLASPKEFVNVYKVGWEQFVIFTITVIATLATDLLYGIAIGILSKIVLHLIHGAPLKALFWPDVEVVGVGEDAARITVNSAAVFSSWIPLKRRIEQIPSDDKLVRRIVLDLHNTKLVDHTVMEKLHEMETDFARKDIEFQVIGLDEHRGSGHPMGMRRKPRKTLARITVVVPASLESHVINGFLDRGAKGYTIVDCRGGSTNTEPSQVQPKIRVETIAPRLVIENIATFIAETILDQYPAMMSVEDVEVIRGEYYA